jgi:prevent-host-death family protein
MKTLPAQELKRRGLAAVESLIADGPVEIIKRNRPACVVISIERFRELTSRRGAGTGHRVSDLFAGPARGRRQRADLDAALHGERMGWGGR